MIIFTNGVFDILHVGHIRLLRFANSLKKDKRDKLIVGINSDESTRRIKGEGRPINNQNTRVNNLREYSPADSVLIFEEDTPTEMMKYLRPDILVKGPEASLSLIPGAEFIQSYGGQVIVPDWPFNESTTRILRDQHRTSVRIADRNPDWDTAEIRFVHTDHGMEPVLYERGRRVIEKYSIHINHDEPKDVNGRSA